MSLKKIRINKPQHLIRLLNEQINAVRNDDELSIQEKARTIGYLAEKVAKCMNIKQEEGHVQSESMAQFTKAINDSVSAFGVVFEYNGQSRINFDGEQEETEEEPSQDRAEPRESQATRTTGGLASNHTNSMF